MIGYSAQANMPVRTGLPLCHEYICRGGSCQEYRGIMFLRVKLNGSTSPEWWLSKSGYVAQSEPEYSIEKAPQNFFHSADSTFCEIVTIKFVKYFPVFSTLFDWFCLPEKVMKKVLPSKKAQTTRVQAFFTFMIFEFWVHYLHCYYAILEPIRQRQNFSLLPYPNYNSETLRSTAQAKPLRLLEKKKAGRKQNLPKNCKLVIKPLASGKRTTLSQAWNSSPRLLSYLASALIIL